MLHINKDDPAFQHGITKSLLNSVTLEVLFFTEKGKQSKQTIWDQPQVVELVQAYKEIARNLQFAWWGAEAPPVYKSGTMKYLNASEELDELLSFDVSSSHGDGNEHGNGAEEVW